MHVYTFLNGQGKYAQVAQHLDALDVAIIGTVLVGQVYSVTTDKPVPQDQAEHLGMTES